jgi:hypothetical protein
LEFSFIALAAGFCNRGVGIQIIVVHLMTSKSSGRREKLRLAGLIIGLIVGVRHLPFLEAGLVILGSVALAWKRPLIGGIVLIAEGLWPLALLIASPLFPSSEALGLIMIWASMPVIAIVSCFPLLTTGVLFLLSWREGRRGPHEGDIEKRIQPVI